MRLYHLLGRPNAALRQFETCCQTLAEELGVEPDTETVALAQEIAARTGAAPPPHLPSALRLARPIALDPGQQMPLIGREVERAALLGHVEAVLAGAGGVVLIEGEVGVGKTRLLQEIARDAEWRGAQVVWGHARELETIPYGPLSEALTAALTPQCVQQLAADLEEIWLGVVSRLTPVLAVQLPDLVIPDALEPAQEGARMLEALARLLEALGQRAPLIVLLEDLHWADTATFDALAYLARRRDNSRVLLVGSYRSGEAREQPVVWAGLQTLQRAGLR